MPMPHTPGFAPSVMRVALVVAMSLAALFPVAGQIARGGSDSTTHVMTAPSAIQWRRAGPRLETAALEGDPSAEGKAYTIALRLAPDSWIDPHWHPNAKRIVVVSGTLLMGMGTVRDTSRVQALGAGSFSLVPAGTRHYEGARGETIIVLYGTGPLKSNFVRDSARVNPGPVRQ